MYLSYYKLAEKPFQTSPDPRFLWLGENHRQAFAALQCGLIAPNGFVVLTGDLGTGKTTFLHALEESLDADTISAKILHPKFDRHGLLKYIAISFDESANCETQEAFFGHMSRFSREAASGRKTFLLIIDEAHLLSIDQLEELRLLSNIESAERKLINIFLVGQNELNHKLRNGECRALSQRVTQNHQLKPFSREETSNYVKHRLRIAGTEDEIFDPRALGEIHRFSQGNPRLINVICDWALMTGYAKGSHVIGPKIIRECWEELRLPQTDTHVADVASEKPAQPWRRLRRDRKALVATVIGLSAMSLLLVFIFTHNIQQGPQQSNNSSVPISNAAAINHSEAAELSADGIPATHDSIDQPHDSDRQVYDLAKAALENKNFDRALELLEESQLGRQDVSPDYRSLVSKALTGQASLVPPGQPKDAESLLRKAIEVDPQNYDAYFQLGKLYTQTKQYPKAVEAYQTAAGLRPDMAAVFYNLGFVYAVTSDYKKAEEALRRAVELHPPFVDKALFNLAMVQLQQGKKQMCIENLERSVSLNPDNSRAREFLEKMRNNTEGPR